MEHVRHFLCESDNLIFYNQNVNLIIFDSIFPIVLGTNQALFGYVALFAFKINVSSG